MAYAPASALTSSISHLPAAYYRRTALDRLVKMLRFYQIMEPDSLPRRTGKTVQWFRYANFAANTTASTEGAIGTGLTPSSSTITATVSEYSDFISLSALLVDVAIDDIVDSQADLLGYRGALSVDTISRAEFDANAGAEIGTLGAAASAADARRVVALLAGADVLPRDGGEYVSVIHPYILYDLQSDNTAGGFIDLLKYANPQGFINGEVGKVGNVRLLSSTNVKTSGTAPSVLYFWYIAGKGGVGAVQLDGSGPNHPVDPNRQAFNVNFIKGGPQIADPEGMIGAAVSYRYVYVAKTLDSTNFRYRMVKADASIV